MPSFSTQGALWASSCPNSFLHQCQRLNRCLDYTNLPSHPPKRKTCNYPIYTGELSSPRAKVNTHELCFFFIPTGKCNKCQTVCLGDTKAEKCDQLWVHEELNWSTLMRMCYLTLAAAAQSDYSCACFTGNLIYFKVVTLTVLFFCAGVCFI